MEQTRKRKALNFIVGALILLFVAIGISDRMKDLRDKTKVTIASMSAAVWPMIISCVIALLLITYVPWFSLFILGR